MDHDSPAATVVSPTVRYVSRITKEPARLEELRAAIEDILSIRDTCWDGEDLVRNLEHRGFIIEEDPRGQSLFVEELTRIFADKRLSLALTTTRGVKHWVFQLISLDRPTLSSG